MKPKWNQSYHNQIDWKAKKTEDKALKYIGNAKNPIIHKTNLVEKREDEHKHISRRLADSVTYHHS